MKQEDAAGDFLSFGFDVNGPYKWTDTDTAFADRWCGLGGTAIKKTLTRPDGVTLSEFSTLCSYSKNYLLRKGDAMYRVHMDQATRDYETLWGILTHASFE